MQQMAKHGPHQLDHIFVQTRLMSRLPDLGGCQGQICTNLYFIPSSSTVCFLSIMAKGNPLRIDPFYPDGHQDFLNMASSSKCPSSVPSATSTIFAYLRRLDTKDDMPSRRKNPLLTLKLS